MLKIDLPFFWFFVLAPVLFVLFHLYVPLQVLLLSRTAAAYNKTINRAVSSAPENALMRQRLANTLFAQIFVGSPREREGLLGWLLLAMACTTRRLRRSNHFGVSVCLPALSQPFRDLATSAAVSRRAYRRLPAVAISSSMHDGISTGKSPDGESKELLRFRFACSQRRTSEDRMASATAPSRSIGCRLIVRWGLPGVGVVFRRTTRQSVHRKFSFGVQCNRWISQKFHRLMLSNVDIVDDEKLDKIEKVAERKKDKNPMGEAELAAFASAI